MPVKLYFVYFRVFYEFLIFIFGFSLEKEKSRNKMILNISLEAKLGQLELF